MGSTMSTTEMEFAFVFIMLLLPIILLIAFYVLAVMVLATAMVYVKAGRPAWLSLVPVYSFVEMLDIAGLSVWWGLAMAGMSLLSAATLFISTSTGAGAALYLLLQAIFCIGTLGFTGYFFYRLARSFGESGWYALGYLLLPIIFFPMLGFGKAKYKGVKKKNDETQKNKLIVTGILTLSLCVLVAVSSAFTFAEIFNSRSPLDAGAPVSGLDTACYSVIDNKVQHVQSAAYLGVSADAFQDLSRYEVDGLCYGRDDDQVYFGSEVIEDADPDTFRFLGTEGFYATDETRVYAGATAIPYADPKNFIDLGQGYAKGKSTVFYAAMEEGDLRLSTIKDADTETFQLASEWNTSYDALDKNNRYFFGAKVEMLP